MGEANLFKELKSRLCTLDELLGKSKDSPFYEPSPSTERDVRKYSKRFRCLVDENDLVLWGNYDTIDARNIMVVFEKCDPNTSTVTC